MKTILLALLAVPCGTSSVSAPTTASTQEGEKAVPAEELKFGYFRPEHSDVNRLMPIAQELLPAFIMVASAAVPGQAKAYRNLQVFLNMGDSILVRGTQEQVDELLQQLERLDESLAKPDEENRSSGRGPEFVDLEYEARFVDAKQLDVALTRFKRVLMTPPPKGDPGAWVSAPNITALSERGMILIREVPERVAEIKAFLERLDTPAPQVTISYLVIQGASEADPGTPALPGALTENLKRLVPFQQFRLQSSGVLRGSSRAPMNVQVDQVQDGPSIRLELEPASFDPTSKTLTLRRCYFQLSSPTGQRMIETGAALRAGEYTVIGAAGRDAVFLVLRLTLE